MLVTISFFDTTTYLYTYMFLYNLSLTVFFWTLFNFIITDFNTLYSFSMMSYNSFFILVLTVLILSMAGVPPFIGFFSNLFIITLILTSSFFLLYSLLLILLFLGLYFYVQNLSFLHSTNHSTLNQPYVINESHNVLFYYTTVTLLTFIGFGFVYIDDVLLFFAWLIS